MNGFTKKLPSSGDLSAMMTKVLTMLKVPVMREGRISTGEDVFLEERLVGAWTGHSERASLPSLAAMMGLPKTERDHLGRWAPSGSDEYIRTYRGIMRKVVTAVVQATQTKDVYKEMDEAEAYESVMLKAMRKGIPEEQARKDCASVKGKAKQILDMIAQLATKESSPSKPTAISYEKGAEGTAYEAKENDQEEQHAIYVVSVASRARRPVACLHSRSGCWRGRGLAFGDYELICEHPPPTNAYNAVCKACWPSGLDPSVMNFGGTDSSEDMEAQGSRSSSTS